jgi:predicted Zn finger-like uncharacterized protein
MPLTGLIPEGGAFFCPHCGALYSVTHSRLPKRDSNIAKCVVCGQTMDEGDSFNEGSGHRELCQAHDGYRHGQSRRS